MPRLFKPQSPQRLPKVLLPEAMHQALQVQASTSGVTIAEAVRQVLTDAITKPLSPSQCLVPGPRIALAPVSAPAELVTTLKSRAWMEQVSVGEIVRRALNDFLTVPAPGGARVRQDPGLGTLHPRSPVEAPRNSPDVV